MKTSSRPLPPSLTASHAEVLACGSRSISSTRLPAGPESCSKVNGGSRLAGAALLVGDGDRVHKRRSRNDYIQPLHLKSTNTIIYFITSQLMYARGLPQGGAGKWERTLRSRSGEEHNWSREEPLGKKKRQAEGLALKRKSREVSGTRSLFTFAPVGSVWTTAFSAHISSTGDCRGRSCGSEYPIRALGAPVTCSCSPARMDQKTTSSSSCQSSKPAWEAKASSTGSSKRRRRSCARPSRRRPRTSARPRVCTRSCFPVS